jgi:glycosyltransferase involved in cell wall biosynthesis
MDDFLIEISIVIPFYNVEKYIAECLESVYAQNIPECKYEVVCVNDCSPDKSRNIILEYQKKHDNLILIEHETNKKLGAARNTGLKASKGKYIWFIDSDDFIKANIFGELLENLESNNLDILQVNSLRVQNNGFSEPYPVHALETNVVSGFEHIEKSGFWNLLNTTWSKIFNRSFLITNQLFFPEGIFFEDNAHSLESMILCNRFKQVDKYYYHYRYNSDSIMNSQLLNNGIKLADNIIMNHSILLICQKYKNYNSFELEKLLTGAEYMNRKLSNKIFKYNKKEINLIYSKLRRFDLNFIKNLPVYLRNELVTIILSGIINLVYGK